MKMNWQKGNEPPENEPDTWSRKVVVITNYDNVFLLSCMNGTWQRPYRFNANEKVEWWIDKPYSGIKKGDTMSMYGIHNGKEAVVKIGKYAICRCDKKSVWIEDTTTGEGGQFSDKKLIPIIEKFYKDNF